jgi:hypothetical protein
MEYPITPAADSFIRSRRDNSGVPTRRENALRKLDMGLFPSKAMSGPVSAICAGWQRHQMLLETNAVNCPFRFRAAVDKRARTAPDN